MELSTKNLHSAEEIARALGLDGSLVRRQSNDLLPGMALFGAGMHAAEEHLSAARN